MLKDLYEVKKTNRLLFLKRNIISIKMEDNETVITFILRINELKNNLGDISEAMSDTNLFMITMNGMTDKYQMLITHLNAREKSPMFEELSWILI